MGNDFSQVCLAVAACAFRRNDILLHLTAAQSFFVQKKDQMFHCSSLISKTKAKSFTSCSYRQRFEKEFNSCMEFVRLIVDLQEYGDIKHNTLH